MSRGLLIALTCFAVSVPVLAQRVPAEGKAPAALEALATELRQARRAWLDARDFSPVAVARQRAAVAALRARLEAMPQVGSPIADQVDWWVLLTELNQQDFEHRVARSPSRNPDFYVQQATGPVPPEPSTLTNQEAAELLRRLAQVPPLLEQARNNLTEASKDHALIALRRIERAAGVREQLSAVAKFTRLARGLSTTQPTISEAATKAAAAMQNYGEWLRANLGRMTAPGHIGLDHFDWYLRNVLLMPYTAKELLSLAQRDYERSMANLAYHENANRRLPPQRPAATEAAYDTLAKDNDAYVRRWLVDANIISIPPDVGPMEATVPWKEGGSAGQQTPTHYWQEIQFRDTLPDHIHAGIPGHKYDGIVSRRNPRPIRAGYSSQGRTEGWGFYLEEMTQQSGLLAGRPRSEELFDNFQLFRYLRMIVDIKMSAGEMTVADAVAFQSTYVPFMEDQVAWVDASGYFLRPTAGSTYTAGKYQIEALVARLRHELGAKFDLKTFHDRFMMAGAIPVSLIEWELTGNDESIKRLGLTR